MKQAIIILVFSTLVQSCAPKPIASPAWCPESQPRFKVVNSVFIEGLRAVEIPLDSNIITSNDEVEARLRSTMGFSHRIPLHNDWIVLVEADAQEVLNTTRPINFLRSRYPDIPLSMPNEQVARQYAAFCDDHGTVNVYALFYYAPIGREDREAWSCLIDLDSESYIHVVSLEESCPDRVPLD